MFTFHWSEFLIVVVGGLVLLVGLAFLMLRRRNEVLQKFLTPEEPNIEEEFFRVRKPVHVATPSEDSAAQEASEAAESTGEATVRWGTPADAASPANTTGTTKT